MYLILRKYCLFTYHKCLFEASNLMHNHTGQRLGLTSRDSGRPVWEMWFYLISSCYHQCVAFLFSYTFWKEICYVSMIIGCEYDTLLEMWNTCHSEYFIEVISGFWKMSHANPIIGTMCLFPSHPLSPYSRPWKLCILLLLVRYGSYSECQSFTCLFQR